MTSMQKKTSHYSIQLLLITTTILLIGLVTVSITSNLVSRHNVRLRHELRTRTNIFARYLAYNSRTPLLAMDIVKLQDIILGLGREKDISRVFITDFNGEVLATTDSDFSKKIILYDSTATLEDGVPWIRTKDSLIWRTYSPIKVDHILDYEENSLQSLMTFKDDESKISQEILGYAIIDVSLTNVMKTLAVDKRNSFIISLIIMGISSFIFVIIAHYLTNPLKQLTKASKSIADGNYDQAVQINRRDEIGVLAESFNVMTEQVKKSQMENLALQEHLEHKVLERTEEVIHQHHELKQAYEELKSLDKAKDDFLSLVSHELRTPLSTILVSTEYLLSRNEMDEKNNKFLSNILDESERLSRLINDVLDLSKIESGRMPFKKEHVNMDEIITQIIDNFRLKLEAKKIRIKHEATGMKSPLLGDKDKLVQVIENILSNSVKFTPDNGEILFTVKYNSDSATVGVKDTGTGISRELIPKIFDKFYQLESIDHHSEGTGLGMTISKSIIDQLGGQIWVESEINKGTTVYFSLPVIKQPDTPAESIDDDTGNLVNSVDDAHSLTKKIVIVDDDEKFRSIMTECLKETGYKVYEAGNGNDALESVRVNNPDLLILDVMMPGMSGLEVCKVLRNKADNEFLKIIITSAKGQIKEQLEGLEAGADHYLTKPFRINLFLETVGKILES